MRLMPFIFLLLSLPATARDQGLAFEPGPGQPFGKPNPEAPKELAQFAFMIGKNDCSEATRDATGEWVEGKRTWDAHYAMNGFAILDAGRSGSNTNSNFRVFDKQSGLWQITFFSMPNYSSGTWTGKAEDERIILSRPSPAPGSGMAGRSVLQFFNITSTAFEWSGTWHSDDGTVEYPFWTISCKKVPAP